MGDVHVVAIAVGLLVVGGGFLMDDTVERDVDACTGSDRLRGLCDAIVDRRVIENPYKYPAIVGGSLLAGWGYVRDATGG